MRAFLKTIGPVRKTYEAGLRTRLAIRQLRLPHVDAAKKVSLYAKERWPLRALLRFNAGVRAVSAMTHRWQFYLQWNVGAPPEWFDTFIAQHYSWRATGLSYGWERGIFNLLAIRHGARVLELCCGGGFFTRQFYAARASEVVAVDFDPEAIRLASRYNVAPNVRFELCDIREGMPDGLFDNVVWDAAIEHFTEAEIAAIMSGIRSRLTPDGILSGHTIKEKADGLQHPEHEREFTSRDDLAGLLRPFFRNVQVLETDHGERVNYYFWASDADLPLPDALSTYVRP